MNHLKLALFQKSMALPEVADGRNVLQLWKIGANTLAAGGAGGQTLTYVNHKTINSILNKEELPDQWKESVIESVHKKGDKTEEISIVGYHWYQQNIYFLNINPSSLSPDINESIGDHQCGFRRNGPTTDHIFCMRQILKKNGNTMREYVSNS
jgi:hypothetical protein